jgi:hypothetical protein
MEIVGRRLALILWDEDGAGDDEVWVHAGTVRASGSGLVLDRGEDEAPVRLLPEWLARIKPVSEDLRAVLLDAEVCISLTVGSIPDRAAASSRSRLRAPLPHASGRCGVYALPESGRQMRGIAPAQIPDAKDRSAMVRAACSPPAPSSCRTSRHKPDRRTCLR